MSTVALYESMSAISAQMVEAATANDWDRLVALEKDCAGLARHLEANGEPIRLSDAERARKFDLIRRILADDQPLPLTPRATAEPPTEYASPRYVEPTPAPVARAAAQPEPAYAPRPAPALPPAAPVFQTPPPMEAPRYDHHSRR